MTTFQFLFRFELCIIAAFALYSIRWIVYPHPIRWLSRSRPLRRRLERRLLKWWERNRLQLRATVIHRSILLAFMLSLLVLINLFG